ncbi:acyl-CoA thioesterase [Natronomonas salina]|uniref:acyl-CoA thioesterase n=1 Tax=Natronomonas salina TaxID=1710540 RepID=UPI0015B5F782|nr:thioesterase family protein [Natronomonas salina]QLD90403.1 acyl-CoA thioesterase [Natronomonas salina]
MESFRFDVELPVRYRDLDTLGHVNNAVYGTYLEQARVRYFDRALDLPFEAREMVLAHVDLDFRRPITLEDGSVRVACGVTDLGTSSIEMAYRVDAGESSEPAATGESVQVAWGGEGSCPLPEEWREQIRAFEPTL